MQNFRLDGNNINVIKELFNSYEASDILKEFRNKEKVYCNSIAKSGFSRLEGIIIGLIHSDDIAKEVDTYYPLNEESFEDEKNNHGSTGW